MSGQPELSPERLAALFDGRLSAGEREEVLAQLAQSDEWRELYADAIVALRGEESAEPSSGVLVDARPGSGSGVGAMVRRRWWAIAASLVVVAGGAWYAIRARAAARDPILAAVERLSVHNAGLPPGWDVRPWSTTRGAGVNVSETGRAVRLGALLVDLELSFRSGSQATGQVVREFASYLEDVPASAPVVAILEEASRRVRAPAAGVPDDVRRVREATRQMVDPDFLAIGAWAEAGRLAALGMGPRNYPELDRDLLDRASRTSSAPEAARTLLRDLGRSMESGNAPAGDSIYAQVLSRAGQ